MAFVTFTGMNLGKYFFICFVVITCEIISLFVFHKSLIKMVYAIAAKSGQIPRWHELEHAIRRNFGGLIEQTPVGIFKRHFRDVDVSRGHYRKSLIETWLISFSRTYSALFILRVHFFIRRMNKQKPLQR